MTAGSENPAGPPEPPANAQPPLTREVRLPMPTGFALRSALRSPWLYVGLSLLLSLVALGYSVRSSRRLARFAQLTAQIDAVRDSISSREDPFEKILRRIEMEQTIREYAPSVDLTVSGLQPTGSGFFASQLEASRVPAGTRVAGLMVNSQSLDYQRAEFEITSTRSARHSLFSRW